MADEMRRTLVAGTTTQTIGTAGLLEGDPGQPTVVVERPWYWVLGIRVVRIYLQTFIGLLTAQGLGVIDIKAAVDAANVGAQWSTFASLALVSLMPTVVGGLQNLLEFVTKVDQSAPLWHA